MAGAAAAEPDSQAVSDLYFAVEALRERTASMYETFEIGGDLNMLISDLAFVRDRASTLQDVAIAWAGALREQL